MGQERRVAQAARRRRSGRRRHGATARPARCSCRARRPCAAGHASARAGRPHTRTDLAPRARARAFWRWQHAEWDLGEPPAGNSLNRASTPAPSQVLCSRAAPVAHFAERVCLTRWAPSRLCDRMA